MTKITKLFLSLALATGLGLGASASAFAQKDNAGTSKQSAPGSQTSGTGFVDENLTFNSAFDVFQILSTTDGKSLTVSVLDCCIEGDQWGQRTYCLNNKGVWDVRGIGRGDISAFTGSTTVHRNGPQAIQCITEFRYSQGVAVFPAGMTARFSSSAGANVTTTPLATRVPLPSM